MKRAGLMRRLMCVVIVLGGIFAAVWASGGVASAANGEAASYSSGHVYLSPVPAGVEVQLTGPSSSGGCCNYGGLLYDCKVSSFADQANPNERLCPDGVIPFTLGGPYWYHVAVLGGVYGGDYFFFVPAVTQPTPPPTTGHTPAPLPVNTAPPTITPMSSIAPGQVLTGKVGTWLHASDLAHQWLSCDAANACRPVGSASLKYTTQAADAGRQIRLGVTAYNVDDKSVTVQSASTEAVGLSVFSGSVDGITTDSAGTHVGGWVCNTGSPAALAVHAYVGGEFITATTANVPDEPAVVTACLSSAPHRFVMNIASSARVIYGGQPLTLYSFDVNGNPNVIGGSPATIPPSVFAGSLDGGVTTDDNGTHVTGWACSTGDDDAMAVHAYVGNSFITGTLANNANEAAVASACQSGTPHRFVLDVPGSARITYGGQQLHLYSFDANGNPHEIAGSPVVIPVSRFQFAFVSPFLTTDAAGEHLFGYACNQGYDNASIVWVSYGTTVIAAAATTVANTTAVSKTCQSSAPHEFNLVIPKAQEAALKGKMLTFYTYDAARGLVLNFGQVPVD
jgi:hypothetical protein